MIFWIFPKVFLLSFFFFFISCSSVVNSHLQKVPMMDAYMSGNNQFVMQQIDESLKDPSWFNSSVVNTGDELMWRLEAGSMNFNMGEFSRSIEEFKIAESLIEAFDERAKISIRDVGTEVGVSLTNLNAMPYRGFCRDRIALSIYKSLAYLGMNNESAFRAQLRRLRETQKKVQDDYQVFFEAEKNEISALQSETLKNSEESTKSTVQNVSETKIIDDPQNKEFSDEMKTVYAIANKGYGHFLNPMAIFLSGLGAIRDENYDNARIDFQRLYEAMPNNPMIQQYYVTVLQLSGHSIPANLTNIKPFDFSLNQDCVYVILANGRSGAFRQISVYFPVMTAWPICEFYQNSFEQINVTADNVKYHSMLLADMDGILAQEFTELLPGIIMRIVLNTLIKEGLYYGGLIAVYNSDMDPFIKGVVSLGIAIVGLGYRAAMNTADTRSWEILPKEFQLTQFKMPENRKIKIKFLNSKIEKELEIPPECKSSIIFINAPSEYNILYHVLPIQSK